MSLDTIIAAAPAPAAPASPLGPWGPCGPIAPATPCGPCAPCGPGTQLVPNMATSFPSASLAFLPWPSSGPTACTYSSQATLQAPTTNHHRQ